MPPPTLAVLLLAAVAAAHAPLLEDGLHFPAALPQASDLMKLHCSTSCLSCDGSWPCCRVRNCPYNAAAWKLALGADGAAQTAVVSSIGAPSLTLSVVRNGSAASLSAEDGGSSFWTHTIANARLLATAGTLGGDSAAAQLAARPSLDLLSFRRPRADGSAVPPALDDTLLSVAVEELVEYEDVDGDARFDVRSDRILRRFTLHDEAWQRAKWTNGSAQRGAVRLSTVRLSNAGGQVTLTCEAASAADQPDVLGGLSFRTGRLRMRTPNATRCALSLRGLPFKGSRSSLAVKLFVVHSASVGCLAAHGNALLCSERGESRSERSASYLSWSPTAAAARGSKDALFEVAVTSQAATLSSLWQSEMSYSLAKSVASSLRDKAVVEVLYFSLAGAARSPAELHWDFALGAGQLPRVRAVGSGWTAIISIATLFVVLGLLALNRDALVDSDGNAFWRSNRGFLGASAYDVVSSEPRADEQDGVCETEGEREG
eukprot:PLAT2455.1.p1 GENE.PLAT2455.1~~PLAT2455.1.p1  ORF type:complete len:488 (+),score=199.36 PLAT2455.1:9-1472(+)